MKLAYGSDIHLEFGQLRIENTEDAGVLILAGDICVAQDFKSKHKRVDTYLEFFSRCSQEFPHVFYVAGNHEHYHGDFGSTVSILKQSLGEFDNITVLDNEIVSIGKTTFIGTTLWTDMNDGDDLTLARIKPMMNDFNCINDSTRPTYRKVPLFLKDDAGEYLLDSDCRYIPAGSKMKKELSQFSPTAAAEEHKKSLDYIDAVIEQHPDNNIIVIGHHAPSHKSIHEEYRHDTIMNGAFASNLDDFIAYRPQIKLWIHGHTHSPFDYMISSTRVVCNPRGYIGHEQSANQFDLKYIDV